MVTDHEMDEYDIWAQCQLPRISRGYLLLLTGISSAIPALLFQRLE